MYKDFTANGLQPSAVQQLNSQATVPSELWTAGHPSENQEKLLG